MTAASAPIAPFALNMEHGYRRGTLYPPGPHPMGMPPEDEVGQHLIVEAERKLLSAGEVGRQFRRKSKVVVPNCAQIIPQRYKKGYEDNLERQYHRQEVELNTFQPRKWRPGGRTIVERSVTDVDQRLQAAASRTWAHSRENSRPGGRYPPHMYRETAAPVSRRQKERDDVLDRIRLQSEEIDASQ